MREGQRKGVRDTEKGKRGEDKQVLRMDAHFNCTALLRAIGPPVFAQTPETNCLFSTE